MGLRSNQGLRKGGGSPVQELERRSLKASGTEESGRGGVQCWVRGYQLLSDFFAVVCLAP
jgi:hypothetical protein